MTRKINIALISAMACAGLTPAQAAPVSGTKTVTGTVASKCGLSNTSVGVTVARDNGNTVTFSTTPTSVTAFCNKASGGILSVSSTRLTGNVNYTIRVTGWGASPLDYNTNSLPAPTAGTNATQGRSTLTFTCQAGCVTNNVNKNTTLTATVTLGVSANP